MQIHELLQGAMQAAGPCVVGILARPGSGKSTIMRHLAHGWPNGPNTVYIIDLYRFLRYSNRFRYLETPADPWIRVPRGGLLLIDEVDRVIATSPEHRRWILDAVNLSRPAGIWVVWNCRRPQRVPRDLTATAKILVGGTIVEPLDLEYCAEFGLAGLDRLKKRQFVMLENDA